MADVASDASKLTDGAKKMLDENDEHLCGFCSLQLLDQDGYVRKQKGSSIEGALHFKSKDDTSVVLEAEFSLNPLFYLHISNEEGNYLFGRWWLNDAKWSKTNQLCTLIPKDTQAIVKQLDGGVEFQADAEVPFLPNSPSKLIKVSFGVKEQRFVTKVIRATVTVPTAAWKEWKDYRLKLWRAGKAAGGADKDDKEEDKDKKDDDKK